MFFFIVVGIVVGYIWYYIIVSVSKCELCSLLWVTRGSGNQGIRGLFKWGAVKEWAEDGSFLRMLAIERLLELA